MVVTFMLDAMPVNAIFIPACIIERRYERMPIVTSCIETVHHERSQVLRILGNMNSKRHISEIAGSRNNSVPSGYSWNYFSTGQCLPAYFERIV